MEATTAAAVCIVTFVVLGGAAPALVGATFIAVTLHQALVVTA